MTGQGNAVQPESGVSPPRMVFRWECRCQQSPVLLATYDDSGRINIKARDRYWHIQGTVQTVCPRCGSEHTLDPRPEARGPEVEDLQARSREERDACKKTTRRLDG